MGRFRCHKRRVAESRRRLLRPPDRRCFGLGFVRAEEQGGRPARRGGSGHTRGQSSAHPHAGTSHTPERLLFAPDLRLPPQRRAAELYTVGVRPWLGELQLDWCDTCDTSLLPLAALAERLSNPEHARISIDMAGLAISLLSCCLSLERCVWMDTEDAPGALF